MTPKDLGMFEPQRRYCDPGRRGAGEHRDRRSMSWSICMTILVKLFSGAKHKHQQQFQKQGKAINDKVRLYSVIRAAGSEGKRQRPLCRHRGGDSRDEFTESVSEAELLARPEGLTTCTWSARTRHPAPLHAGLAGGAGTARRAGRARRAGSRADPA
ncbi:hypothetical protein [Citrobacter freundii]|uniref:hypothetical protein n=1 Tax=Citrobacter freundii TaxID=546 RepID=UPI00388EBD26